MVTLTSLNPFATAHTPKATTTITQLFVYPIKSCRGISLQQSFLTKRGLDFDRRWMFVDASTHKFLTIRDIPQMTLIDTAFASGTTPAEAGGDDDLQLVISIRDTDQRVSIPARPTQEWLEQNTTLLPVEIWENETDGYLYNDDINAIFTSFFRKPVALVHKGPTPRILRGNGAPELIGRTESTNFPDVLPLQIANKASLVELNSRLKEKGQAEITVGRFRPNIIVAGGEDVGMAAWTEDDWKTVRIVPEPSQASTASTEERSFTFSSLISSVIGQAANAGSMDIDIAARCARCQVPNVEPETAVKDKHEPWDTLVSYRRVDEGIKWKPCFGMLSVPRNEGEIKVGMKLEVLETTKDHRYVKGF